MPGLRPTRVVQRSAAQLLVVASVAGLVAFGSPAAASAGGDLIIDGRGWGHGVGLAQDGALAMGRAGADVSEILDHFYPGTTDGSAAGTVRVVASTGPTRQAIVSFPGGGQLRATGVGPQPSGFPIVVPPATAVAVSVDGASTIVGRPSTQPDVRPASIRTGAASRIRTAAAVGPTADVGPPPGPGTTTTTVRPTATTTPTVVRPSPPSSNPLPTPSRPAAPAPPAPPASPAPSGETPAIAVEGPVIAVPAPGGTTLLVDRQRRYRGTLEIGAAGGVTRIVNELDVEDYLRGMGEVREPSWPPAALQAQAVAARTYALHAMAVGGEICADDRCQVYLSADVEYPAMDDAIRATRSRVRRSGSELATSFYSANGGGVSATPEEGFGPGGTDLPYLRAAPYPTDDPDPWTVRMDLAEVARRLGYQGRLSEARVSRAGPSGRALDVTLDGDAGPLILGGQKVAARLQLRSTLFAFGENGVAESTSPAPLTPARPPGAEASVAPAVPAAGTGPPHARRTTRVVIAVSLVAALVAARRYRPGRPVRRAATRQ